MDIIIVSHYFWPESFIINEISNKLVQAGNKVTVLTGKPNYPDGKIFSGYKFWGIQKEVYNGVDVFRIPLIPRGNGGGMRLVLNYFSFVVFGSLFFPCIVSKRKVDAILFFEPSPLTSTIPAIILKFIKRKRLYLWVQDLWPESLSATGFIKNKGVLNTIELLVKWIYTHSDKLLIQSEAFREPVSRLADEKKIIYYPNSVDGAAYRQISPSYTFEEHSIVGLIGKRFSVVFAGNIGTAQSVNTIITAAEILSANGMKIDFFLVGSGSRLIWAQKEVQHLRLDNVHFPGRFPMGDMPSILSRADVLLVTLKDHPIFNYTIPSKIQAYLAVGKPIVACLNGEGARVIVKEAKAGIACPAEDPSELAEAVSQLYGMSVEDRRILGENGKRYFKEHFDMDLLVDKLVDIMKL